MATYEVRIWKHFLNDYYAEIGTDNYLVKLEMNPSTREITNTSAYGHSRWAGEDFFEGSTLISKTSVSYNREGYPTHVWEAIAERAVMKLYGNTPTLPKKFPKIKQPKIIFY
jgi:hypothetical protein